MTPRLHVLLGAGGVGKTTLAASYALALARAPGRCVGLLGIDPSHRLKDALHVALGDLDAPVPDGGALRAAVLEPAQSLRRWATEACPDPATRDRLIRNPFFAALADRLAAATDIFAAARVAEWAERDGALTDLVIDTAPGLNAIEFLTRPERVAAFLGGRLVGWLRFLARDEATGGRLRGAALRAVGGLSRMGGTRMLGDLADFFSLVDAMFARLLERVRWTQRWLRDETTELLVVTSAHQDGVGGAAALVDALCGAGLAPDAVIVNRALPAEFTGDEAQLEAAGAGDARAEPLVRYALALGRIQARVIADVSLLAPRTAIVPETRGLDGEARLEPLIRMGQVLREQLRPPGGPATWRAGAP